MNIKCIETYNSERKKCMHKLYKYLDGYFDVFENAAFGCAGKVIIQFNNGLGIDITTGEYDLSYIQFISCQEFKDFLEKEKEKENLENNNA